MKYKDILFIAFFSILLSACTTPADYCENIVSQTSELQQNLDNIWSKIEERNMEDAMVTYETNYVQTQNTLESLKKIDAFNDKDDSLRTAAIQYTKAYINIYENEYAEIFRILKSRNTDADADAEKVFVLLTTISKKIENEKNTFTKEIINFSRKYDLRLTE